MPYVEVTGEGIDETLNTKVNNIQTEVVIVEDHLHPPLSRINPSARFRRGGITFSAAPVGGTLTIGTVSSPKIYTIVAALGVPAANNVQILNQGTLDLNIRKLSQAIQGITDVANIAYGAGTQPHPDIFGYYTSQRFAVGTVQHAPAGGSSLMVKEKVGDQTDTAVALTIALGGGMVATTTTAFTRVYSHRYILSGNAAALGNRIAGPYQTFVPMNSVRDSALNLVRYDIDSFIVEAVSSITMIIEADVYYSVDEVTFVLLSYGNNLSREILSNGSQQTIQRCSRVPAGAGLYLKIRSDGTVPATDNLDLKVQLHQYPVGV